jgi:hypothetical protein
MPVKKPANFCHGLGSRWQNLHRYAKQKACTSLARQMPLRRSRGSQKGGGPAVAKRQYPSKKQPFERQVFANWNYRLGSIASSNGCFLRLDCTATLGRGFVYVPGSGVRRIVGIGA